MRSVWEWRKPSACMVRIYVLTWNESYGVEFIQETQELFNVSKPGFKDDF